MKMTATVLLVISLVAQANTTEKFAGLNQLTGQCWQATFPDGKKVDTHCFSEVYSGAFIKDQHVVCGEGQPYFGETWYVYDAKSNQVTYRYYNSMGGISDGSVEYKDHQLLFPDEVYEQAGQSVTYRTNWDLSDGQYTSTMSQQTERGWKPVWEMVFKSVDLHNNGHAHWNKQGNLACPSTEK